MAKVVLGYDMVPCFYGHCEGAGYEIHQDGTAKIWKVM